MSQNTFNLGSVEKNRKVNMEGMKVKIKGVTSAYVKSLYRKVLEIIFIHKTLINRA
jgi:hypothetical protein